MPATAEAAYVPDLLDAHEALMQFLYQSPIGLVQTTLDGSIVMINPASARLLMPLSPDGGLDNLFAVLDAVAPQVRERTARFAGRSGVVCDGLRVRLAAEARRAAEPQVLSISVLKLDESRLMATLHDVTLDVRREQQGLARQLSSAARIDPLTQIPNRAAVRERLQQAITRAQADARHQFAVLFINGDRFKRINDTLGPAVGDEVLGCMARRLRAALRTGDVLGRDAAAEPMAARVGGDEFVVVLDDLPRADDAHVVAQRVLDVLAKPYGVGAHQVHVDASMGVLLRAQARGDADAVLKDASIAMAEAKRAGGARYAVFEPAMQDRAARRGALEGELRRALAEGELFVVYQPVVGLARGAASTGVEALVRWRHPSRGLVAPAEFIGVAEESGLIGALGDFVLATASRQFMAWQAALGARAPGTLAVNLSRAQLVQPALAASVRDILRAAAMPPGRLQLEVTESLAAQDATVQARLHELKALGLTLALDDFGTGYSSLASLHQLPVDTIKIDRSFVSQADSSRHHRVLIEATVRVADSLGLDTVAEGIETAAQAAVVRELGCAKGQGYLFSRPLGAEDAAGWLAGRG